MTTVQFLTIIGTIYIAPFIDKTLSGGIGACILIFSSLHELGFV